MKVFQHSCYAMGTRFHMVIPNKDDHSGGALGSYASRLLTDEEQRLSRFLPSSELSAINREAYPNAFNVSDEMKTVLELCHQFHQSTQGAFNPVLFETTKTRDNGEGTEHTAAKTWHRGWNNIEWAEGTILFGHQDIQLDLGGFGKGWGMEKIIAMLKTNHVHSAFISFGESTLTVLGGHPLGGPWEVEIPGLQKDNSLKLSLMDESISVSGLKNITGETQKGKKPHIFSPSTQKMITEDRLTLVRSAEPLKAEILSTALMAADNWQKTAILHNFPHEEFFEYKNEGWIRLMEE
jgi:FAD:protein FMN transferase